MIDAIGPEVYTFKELVTLMISRIRPGVKAIHVPPAPGIALGNVLGLAVRDVLLTRHELQGLMAGLLTSEQAPNGTARFSDWLAQHRTEIGRAYASELRRHFKCRPHA